MVIDKTYFKPKTFLLSLLPAAYTTYNSHCLTPDTVTLAYISWPDLFRSGEIIWVDKRNVRFLEQKRCHVQNI